MNQLAQLLRATPSLVDELVGDGGESVAFGRLVELLPVDRDVAERALADPVVGSYIAESYLGALDIDLWRRRIAEARPARRGLPSEWVTFVRGRRSGRGVTLPEDSATEGRIALFTDVNGSPRRISIDRPTRPDASVSLALERRCAPADFGECLAGGCGCVARKVHAPDAVYCECGDGSSP